MKTARKIIEIDEELCTGCGQCIVDCAEAALQIIDGKAKLVADKYCDGLGACLGGCPTGALKLIERSADDFDEEAVEKLLKAKNDSPKDTPLSPPKGGCPSARLQSFQAVTPCQSAKPFSNLQSGPSASALGHWPIQIRLVPPTAPFLKNADLLVAADCTTVAATNFHSDFLKNRVIMMGCPKFDDAEGYVAKFKDIFKTAAIRSITILIMEVPCCQSMKNIVRAALDQSGKKIDAEVVTLSARGEVIQKAALQ
jgi:Pyruvate/2-oxoacid:ferredoxin oxidoreductase delta subunit